MIRERAYDPSFGSVAIVRRAGLDLRNNLKWLSFGHLNVLRVEVMQLLEEAFKILDSHDVKRLFGTDNAWDVVEEVLIRYFNERLVTSPRQRMGVTGREVLRWLAQPHILQTTRAQFETLLLKIAEPSEEWLTSAQAMGLSKRTGSHRVLPWDRTQPTPVKANGGPRPGVPPRREPARAFMARTGPADEQILQDAKVERGWGESGFSLYERTTIRPALTVNGIVGGHHGPGVKGIIPAQAIAKLSFRLVPDQDPQKVAQLFRDHIGRITPPAVRSSLRTFSAVEPALVDRNHPAVRAAALAYKKGFGALPVFVRSGGSIPVVNTFQEILGIPAVLMGFGLPDDHIHGPNEKFHLPNFYKAIATSVWYLAVAAKLRGAQPRQKRAEWRNP